MCRHCEYLEKDTTFDSKRAGQLECHERVMGVLRNNDSGDAVEDVAGAYQSSTNGYPAVSADPLHVRAGKPKLTVINLDEPETGTSITKCQKLPNAPESATLNRDTCIINKRD